ncbi:MAG: hypothetical protein RR623_08140 [Bacilli bacterium]|uniref:hypothetical protein n=1 Tax=Anaerorhabdus sp. TaxID=1872524 RepID=UPI002FCAE5B2
MNMLLIILIEIVIILALKYLLKHKIITCTNGISNEDTSKKKILFILLAIAYLSFVFSYVFKRDITEVFDFEFIMFILQVLVITLLGEILFRKYLFYLCMNYMNDFNIAGYLQAVLYAMCATTFFANVFTLENYSIPFMFGTFLVLGKLLQVMYFQYLKSSIKELILIDLISFIISITACYILL